MKLVTEIIFFIPSRMALEAHPIDIKVLFQGLKMTRV
jgi:hypothetical protein